MLYDSSKIRNTATVDVANISKNKSQYDALNIICFFLYLSLITFIIIILTVFDIMMPSTLYGRRADDLCDRHAADEHDHIQSHNLDDRGQKKIKDRYYRPRLRVSAV